MSQLSRLLRLGVIAVVAFALIAGCSSSSKPKASADKAKSKAKSGAPAASGATTTTIRNITKDTPTTTIPKGDGTAPPAYCNNFRYLGEKLSSQLPALKSQIAGSVTLLKNLKDSAPASISGQAEIVYNVFVQANADVQKATTVAQAMSALQKVDDPKAAQAIADLTDYRNKHC